MPYNATSYQHDLASAGGKGAIISHLTSWLVGGKELLVVTKTALRKPDAGPYADPNMHPRYGGIMKEGSIQGFQAWSWSTSTCRVRAGFRLPIKALQLPIGRFAEQPSE